MVFAFVVVAVASGISAVNAVVNTVVDIIGVESTVVTVLLATVVDAIS